MGQSGKTVFGLSSYFKMPNRKKNLLTKEFLQTFKDELIKADCEYREKHNRPKLDYNKETYASFYGEIEGTGLFYHALEIVCKKYNLTKAIYMYTKKMPWYDSDYFEEDLCLEMVAKGIIKEYNDYKKEEYDESKYLTAKYKLVRHHKGFDEIKYGLWRDDDKKGLENIYKDNDWEVIWLN